MLQKLQSLTFKNKFSSESPTQQTGAVTAPVCILLPLTKQYEVSGNSAPSPLAVHVKVTLYVLSTHHTSELPSTSG